MKQLYDASQLQKLFIITLWVFINMFAAAPVTSYAATANTNVTVTATVFGPAPTIPAIITAPKTEFVTYVTPIVIRGTCGASLTVKIFNYTTIIGTSDCAADGTFTINAILNLGRNELSARNYDFQDQAGPASATVIVFVLEPSLTTKSQPSASTQTDSSGNYPPSPAIHAPDLRAPSSARESLATSSVIVSHIVLTTLLVLSYGGAGLRFVYKVRKRKNKTSA